MDAALYFRILSISLGALMVLRWPAAALRDYRRKKAPETAASAHPPFAAWLAAVVALIVVAATWWMQARQPVDYSLAVTLVATVCLVWTSQMLFNYARFREVRTRLSSLRPGLVIVFRLSVALAGVALILLGVLVYR